MIEHAMTCSIFNGKGEELLFSSGNGGCVVDNKGKKYIDFILGFGPVILGHNNSEFNKLISDYINNGIHLPSYTIFHKRFVDEILKLSEKSVSFFKTSSESVTAALRIVAQINNKKSFIRCGYIGWHDAQIANSISWHEYLYSKKRYTIKHKNGFRGISKNEIVYNWADLNINSLEKIIRSDDTIGCLIIDMFQLHFMSINILTEAIKLCHSHDIMIVLDETKTSGRFSTLGITDLYKLDYDFLVLGKALANGAPLSLLVGSQKNMKNAKNARITGTFSKELLGVWCGLATASIMSDNDGYNKLSSIGKNVCNVFNDAIKNEKIEKYLECIPILNGSMFDLKFSKIVIDNNELREKLRRYFVDEGILILQGHPSFICLAHDNIDYDKLLIYASLAMKKWKNELVKQNV